MLIKQFITMKYAETQQSSNDYNQKMCRNFKTRAIFVNRNWLFTDLWNIFVRRRKYTELDCKIKVISTTSLQAMNFCLNMDTKMWRKYYGRKAPIKFLKIVLPGSNLSIKRCWSAKFILQLCSAFCQSSVQLNEDIMWIYRRKIR